MTRLALLLSLVIGACAGSRTAAVPPGQVVRSGDTTFHTRDGGAIDVTVRRTFRGHDATGTATLRGMTLEAAQRSALVRVAAARAWLSIGAALAADPPAAYEAAQRGTEELGTDYRATRGSRHVIDDTGHNILRAKMAAQDGDHVRAAEIITGVLRARIALHLRASQRTVE